MDTAAKTLTVTGRYYRQYPSSLEPLGYAQEALDLDPARTALVVVDVYGRGFDDEDEGAQGDADVPEFYAIDPLRRDIVRNGIVPAKRAAKQAGLPVIYLTNHLSPGLGESHEWRRMSIRTCDVDVLEAWREPTDVLAFSRVIAPDEDDVVIPKQMYSGFFEASLDSTLRSRGIRDLVVVGFDSRICLGNTVTDAIYRGYRVVVLRDCVHTMEFPETQQSQMANFLAVRFIETNVGYTATAAEFIDACGRLVAS